MASTVPELLNSEHLDPGQWESNFVEFCKNLLFASHHKECTSSSELLQKVVALRCIQEHGILRNHESMRQEAASYNFSTYKQPYLFPGFISPLQPSTSNPLFNIPIVDEDQDPSTPFKLPLYFHSVTFIINKLAKEGVDRIVAEDLALDHLSTPTANPRSFMSKVVCNGSPIWKIDEVTVDFIKTVLKRLHKHEEFSTDGAPYPFDVKSALRFSEHLHNQIPPLVAITPPYIAHEVSITLTAMGRFMAMHEINVDIQLLFPVETASVDEYAYHSAVFWTYREAFKKYYYPTMMAPLPPKFLLTDKESAMLRQYWDAGNRHVTASESAMLARRCDSLAPFQVYGYFEQRRRREYRRYRDNTDEEALAIESTRSLKNLRQIGFKREKFRPNLQDDSGLDKHEIEKLNLLYQLGHRDPGINECELLASSLNIEDSVQIKLYFMGRDEESRLKRNK
ncbi:unnamed protein product [Caenorhabditis sp. 36 PRJEB53466]|nr:unnamed protein product [Caenorhabditis sp. 36 PRJEB53466]